MVDSLLSHLTPQVWYAWQMILLTALVVGFTRAAFALYRQ